MLEIINAGLAPDFVPYHDGWALQRQRARRGGLGRTP